MLPDDTLLEDRNITTAQLYKASLLLTELVATKQLELPRTLLAAATLALQEILDQETSDTATGHLRH